MNGFRFYEVRLELETPAVIPLRITRTGYLEPATIIPGATLRGAVITSLYSNGLISPTVLENEVRKPSILATPAYPVVVKNGREYKTLPATPFMFRCKVCGKTADQTVRASETMASGSQPVPAYSCPSHGPAESLYGRPIYVGAGGLESYAPKTTYAVSVGVNKFTATSMKGMLYNYEAIDAGEVFWARLTVPEELVDKLPRKLEVLVGRGRSRGFGRAKIELKDETLPHRQGSKVFIAYSHLTPLEELSYAGLKVRIRSVCGRLQKILMGWDMAVKAFKPFAKVVRAGALVAADVSGEDSAASTMLLSHGGIPLKTGNVWLTGLNVLTSLEDYGSILNMEV